MVVRKKYFFHTRSHMNFHRIFRPDQAHPTVFIASGAVVLGDVTLGENSSVWFQAVVRGDTEAIRVGRRTNIQDGVILHADPGFPCILGDGVTVGHRAIVHGANVADNVLIGMGAVVLNAVQIGEYSIVGAGAVIPEGTIVPPRSVVLGVPGIVRRAVDEDDLRQIAHAAEHYVAAAAEYRKS